MDGNKERDSLPETKSDNKEISEKEISQLSADFKKMVLKGAAGGSLLPVLLTLSTGMVATATYFALKDDGKISKEIKEKVLEIGDAAQKMTQEAFDKIGIENPFKKEFKFGGGESRGKGASGSWGEEQSGSGGGEGPNVAENLNAKEKEAFDGFHKGRSGGAGTSGKW